MNKFFTRKWYEYIYNEMIDCLPKVCYLKHFNNDYFGKGYNNFFDKVINNNDKYNLDEILISKFEKYLARKKDYINKYSELEKRFEKYEKIDELGIYDEELTKYISKLNYFVKVTRGEFERIIEKLKNNNIVVDITLEDEEFLLLGLYVLKSELRKKYMEIKRIYRENLDKYDNLTENELDKIDYIRNDVDAFLTCKTDYLANREEKFDDIIDKIWFHDSIVVKYEKNGNDAILELKEEGSNNLYRRFIFKNVLINVDIEDEEKIDLMNAKSDIESGIVEINGADYGNYEDYNYYLKLFYSWTLDEMESGGKKDLAVTSFVADKIIIEDVIPYPLLTKYKSGIGYNLKNYDKYKNILSDKGYSFFTSLSVGMYFYDNLKYDDNEILISFKAVMKPYDFLNINFLDVSFNMDKAEFKNKIEMLKKNRVGSSCIRIIDYNNNKYEVGLLLSYDEELIFRCSKILFEGDNSNILEQKWIDLGKAWDVTYENAD